MADAMAQPNEEAANHHIAVTPRGQDTGPSRAAATTLAVAARQGGGATVLMPSMAETKFSRRVGMTGTEPGSAG